jgi:hypothetical protein
MSDCFNVNFFRPQALHLVFHTAYCHTYIKMPENQKKQNVKKYKTEFIVIISLMIIVAAYIFVQVLPKW